MGGYAVRRWCVPKLEPAPFSIRKYHSPKKQERARRRVYSIPTNGSIGPLYFNQFIKYRPLTRLKWPVLFVNSAKSFSMAILAI